MKVALDAMGGDKAPSINIAGAKRALAEFSCIDKLYLVGRESDLQAGCDRLGLRDSRLEIVPASEVVEMNDSGIMAVRQKKDSSMSVAVGLVKSGDADAVVSAGNTGAAVAASTIKLRLLPGVERAGILSPMPSQVGSCYVMDTGANPEAKPSHLLGYAVMASLWAKYVGHVQPVVGIMSNGEEDEKGNEVTKEAFKLIKSVMSEHDLPFSFIGNVEGNDVFTNRANVILTDGFTGNVLLKGCEGTAKAMAGWLKTGIDASWWRKLGGLIVRGAFVEMKNKLAYEQYGGCPLLGVNGVSIIAHGSSNALAIYNALRVAGEVHKYGINPQIEEVMVRLDSLDLGRLV